MSGHYREHSQNKYAYEPYSSTESLSLQLKKVCLFFWEVKLCSPGPQQTDKQDD